MGILRDLIDQSETEPKMRPNENTFGTILKFLADSDLPDKGNRARAIENLMNIFLEREPKEWIKRELRRSLSSTESDVVSFVGASPKSLGKSKKSSKEINGSQASCQAQKEHD